ncbi:MAG: hypothetical protein R2680_05250 [Nitrososphaeraceae archaeon]
MWNIYLRGIIKEEMTYLHWLLVNDPESGYRARIILINNSQ